MERVLIRMSVSQILSIRSESDDLRASRNAQSAKRVIYWKSRNESSFRDSNASERWRVESCSIKDSHRSDSFTRSESYPIRFVCSK